MVKFYGCFMGDYTKRYRWQCKSFESKSELENEKDATEFALKGSPFSHTPTLLIEKRSYVPKCLEHYMLSNAIRESIGVDIFED